MKRRGAKTDYSVIRLFGYKIAIKIVDKQISGEKDRTPLITSKF